MNIKIGETFVKEFKTQAGIVVRRGYQVKKVSDAMVTVTGPSGEEIRRKVCARRGYMEAACEYYIKLSRGATANLKIS